MAGLGNPAGGWDVKTVQFLPETLHERYNNLVRCGKQGMPRRISRICSIRVFPPIINKVGRFELLKFEKKLDRGINHFNLDSSTMANVNLH